MAIALRPPGPGGHFLTGSLPEFRHDPLGFFTRCAREYGDIVSFRMGLRQVFLLSRPDYIEYVLVANSGNFTKARALKRSRLLFGDGLLTSEGDLWLRQRRLIQPAFHRQRIASYGDTMVAYAERMLEIWRDGQTVDVHEEMMRLTLEIVARTLFDAEVGPGFGEVGEAMKVLVGNFMARSYSLFLIPESIPTPGNLRNLGAVRRLERIIYRIIDQRRASGKDRGDLLSMLLEAQDEDGGRMTDRQLRDEVMTLFLAGHETTALALSWTWYLLSQHPEVEARLVDELRAVLEDRVPTVADLPRLQYTGKVVSESMRLYPPVWAISRKAIAEFEVGGYRIPAGSVVSMSQWVMHRDPRYFDRPEEFDPDRWTDGLAKGLPKFAYFPFGAGPRHCIGSSFALTEATLLLATIARRFHLSLIPDQAIVPLPSITLRPRNGIKMVLSRRCSASSTASGMKSG